MARDYLKGRGLNEEICREFRLGLALGGTSLARKALEKGFTREELRAAGLTPAARRRLLPAAAPVPARRPAGTGARLPGAQAARGRSAAGEVREHARVGALPQGLRCVYGLDKARASIAREDRACVVEGNTDVIALRQAGFEPVVASMGTALTEQQLKELGRLTKRLWLAFDGDAAGETATLRGMELAAKQGFDVKVVALPAGVDPADDPQGFQRRLAGAEPYLLYRVRIELERGEDREVSFRTVKALLDEAPDSPERHDAWRFANDKLGMTVQLRAGGSSRAPRHRRRSACSTRARSSSATRSPACSRIPSLKPLLAELTPEHFYDPVHRALRAHIVDGDAARCRTRSGCSPSSTHGPSRRGSTRAPGRSCSGVCASARCAASCSTPIPCARRSCRRRCSACSSESRRSPAHNFTCKSGCFPSRLA